MTTFLNNNTTLFFQRHLALWYDKNKRALPWRDTRDPYKIWLSEVILQQTRVNQGLPYYLKFIDNFPTVEQLAAAPEEKILRNWQGLGYYSRAKNLHKCAKIIVDEYGGKFPKSGLELNKLPGIGSYTSAAIASFCYKEPIAVVDGNVFRVLSRVFGVHTDISSSKGAKEFNDLANKLIDNKNPDVHNQAIMEFGANHCTPKNPQCDTCPMEKKCYAKQQSKQAQLPVKLGKTKTRDRYFYYIVHEKNGNLAMKARDQKDIWSGLYDFPYIEFDKKQDDESILKFVKPGEVIDSISKEYKHLLSHQRIFAVFIKVIIDHTVEEYTKTRYYTPSEIAELPKPVLINNYLKQYFF